ncbi:MAG: Tad domain-containing protein [Myxococcota bacterium]|nr:Tad domain-containing protein [Myxococcota bacterium]
MRTLLRRLFSDERSSGAAARALSAIEQDAIGPVHGPALPSTIRDVWKPRSLRALRADESGAMMVMGIFMAMMLVGMIYYLMGIGDAIVYRERMQDAADSSAFAGAVLHARGMNFIVLINIIMAALLAILVALKLVETLCWMAIFAIYAIVALSFGTASALLGFVPILQSVQQATARAYDTLKEPIMRILTVCDTTQGVVARVVPVVAQVRVIQVAADVYSPPAQVGFAWPLYRPLPVVDDSFSELCERAGETAGRIAMLPFSFLPDEITDKVARALGRLAGTFSAWFCGTDGGSGSGEPPSLTYDVVSLMPDNPEGDSAECSSSRTDDTADPDACERYEAWYNEGNECAMSSNPPESCSGAELAAYNERIAAGRSACRPTSGTEDFVWERARFSRTERWIWVGSLETGHWDYSLSAPTIVDNGPTMSGCAGGRSASGSCCTAGGCACGATCIDCENNCTQPGVLIGGSTRVIERDENQLPCSRPGLFGGTRFEPYQAAGPFVCAEEITTRGCDCPGTDAPGLLDGCSRSVEGGGGISPRGDYATCDGPRPSAVGATYSRTIEFDAIVNLLSCSRTTEETLPVDDTLGAEGTEDGNCDKCPKKLLDCAQLGEERFQLRTFVLGDVSQAQRADAGVRLAAWGHDGGASYSSVMNLVGRLSFAQAEYMFWERGEIAGHDTSDRDGGEYMWHMFWTARMRRFRVGMDDTCGGGASATGDSADTPDAACEGAAADGGGGCDTGGGIGAFLSDAVSAIIIH